jgi:hypothetical protein
MSNIRIMPVEIRELIIQARLKEDVVPEQDTAPAHQRETSEPDHEQLAEVIYERCMARLKEWLADQSSR